MHLPSYFKYVPTYIIFTVSYVLMLLLFREKAWDVGFIFFNFLENTLKTQSWRGWKQRGFFVASCTNAL